MGKGIVKRVAIILVMMTVWTTLSAQTTFGGVLRIDRTVQDWGDVTVGDGPLSCSFEIENVSDKDICISSVVSSCGCTGVKWTREPLHPGDKGCIVATYSNDEGALQFDKTLAVYVQGIRKPLVLHLRGVVHKKKLPLSETYPVHFGELGVRKAEVKIGNLSQGEEKSSVIKLANTGKREITVSFTGLSEVLSISPMKLSIPAQSTAEIVVTVSSDRSLWGRNSYFATPVVNGKSYGTLSFFAVTRESFDSMSAERLESAPEAEYEGSAAPAPVAPGQRMEAEFTIHNRGRTALRLYRIDFDANQLELLHPAKNEASIPTGGSATLKFRVKTEDMQADSENLCVVSLYTNDPKHSIINLYIDAIIL